MPTAVAHRRPIAPLPVDRFAATMTNRQIEIGFGSTRLHFAMRSSRVHRATGAATVDQGGSLLWRAMGYVGCASLALGVVVASGSVLRASPPVDPYAVVLPIDAKPSPRPPAHKAKPRPAVRARMVTPFTPVAKSDDWPLAPAAGDDDTDLGTVRPDADVATLPTVNGERAVAVYGPTRIVDGKSCRDVTVFVRDVDGKVSASPTTACKAR